MKREREAGFTLIELLVGVGISLGVLITLSVIAAHLISAAASFDLLARGDDATGRLAERLQSESASAWAVFVPANDVNGLPNADGHELDFYAQDGAHRSYAWAYVYDRAMQRVTRYDTAGTAPAAGDRYAPIAAFSAMPLLASAVASWDPLFAGAAALDVRYAFGGTTALGGNGIVRLHVATRESDRTEFLSSATAPTSFTVIVSYTPSPAPVPTPTATPIAVSTPPA